MTWSRQLFQFVLCGHPTPRCWSFQKRELSSRVGLFRSRLRTLGTHYHPTLDLAVLWTPSNDTSRPIFSDSLNLTPPAPLYLRTLWRYTNAVIIIIIMNGWYEDLLPLCLEFLNQKLVWLILNLRFYICEFELCFLSMMNDGTFCRQVTVDSVLHSYSLIV